MLCTNMHKQPNYSALHKPNAVPKENAMHKNRVTTDAMHKSDAMPKELQLTNAAQKLGTVC